MPPNPENRRPPALRPGRGVERARRAARLWGEVTLAGITVLGGLTIWHLRRRARLIHERAQAPRRVDWPDLDGGPAGSDT